mmetsp:Transcript_19686/g.35625  ORF Transcript_19686/g.35625 Transcript_19686/m.35625 type:complete len:203 (-) Transcript_19686:139-747(-)
MGALPCCIADDAPAPKGAVATPYADEFSAVPQVQVAGSVISEPAEVKREDSQTLPPAYYDQAPALSDGPAEEVKAEPTKAAENAAALPVQAETSVTQPMISIESQVGAGTEEGCLELYITRGGLDDRLGLDLKHCKTYLLVKNIQEGDTADKYNQSQTDPKRRLERGDTIWKVNDVEQSDVEMIKECRDNLKLTIHVKKATK